MKQPTTGRNQITKHSVKERSDAEPMTLNNMTTFTPNTEGVFFDLPAEIYHKAPGISQSTLKAFDEAGSPRHFQKVKRKAPSAEMQFGTLAHAGVLEPNAFAGLFHVRPDFYESTVKKCPTCGSVSYADKCRKCGVNRESAKVQKAWNNGSDTCAKWMEDHAGKTIIDTETHNRLDGAIASLTLNASLFSRALTSKHARREVSYFKRDPETGLLLKARCDLVVTDTQGKKVIFDPKK